MIQEGDSGDLAARARQRSTGSGRTAAGLIALGLAIVPPQAASAADKAQGSQAPAANEQVTPVRVPRGDQPQLLPERMAAKFDTRLDQYDTEVLNDLTGRTLGRLRALLEAGGTPDPTTLAEIFGDELAADDLKPEALSAVFDDGSLRVRRWSVAAGTPLAARKYRGPGEAAQVVQRLRSAFGRDGKAHVEFKTIGVEQVSERLFTTRVLMHGSGTQSGRILQINADWECRWEHSETAPDAGPRLVGIGLERYEEVTLSGGQGPLFRDSTTSAMRHDASYAGQVLRGLGDWMPRVSQLTGMTDYGNHGLAVGDVNGDGLDDLYVCDTGGLPNRLYVQQPDGSVKDIAHEAGVDWLDYSAGVLLIDLDNDGDQDLALAARSGILIAENDGKAGFTLRRTIQGVGDPVSLAAADYDHDGDLDLFVCNYRGSDLLDPPSPVPLYDARNGGANVLLRNDGDYRMTDVTLEAGMGGQTRFSFAAAWEDYDNDGDVDLYVANDFGPNNLYRNDGGTFVDVARAAAVEDRASGMSVSWGDFNRDGWMDAYVGNMFSSAGHRVSFQHRFAEASGGETPLLQRFARGNTLFANAGDGSFLDVSGETSTTNARWAWASKFIDINNDGWQDLLVANGYLTNEDSGDL